MVSAIGLPNSLGDSSQSLASLIRASFQGRAVDWIKNANGFGNAAKATAFATPFLAKWAAATTAAPLMGTFLVTGTLVAIALFILYGCAETPPSNRRHYYVPGDTSTRHVYVSPPSSTVIHQSVPSAPSAHYSAGYRHVPSASTVFTPPPSAPYGPPSAENYAVGGRHGPAVRPERPKASATATDGFYDAGGRHLQS